MELNQNTLFGQKTIQSVGYNEQEIIKDILYLHCDSQPIECDPTYSVGNFYKDGLTQPKYKFDLNPSVPGVVQADARKLPLEDNSINVLMFDPPFIVGDNAIGVENLSLIRQRFSHYKDMKELWDMYLGAIREFERVIVPNGILIFKCQDSVSSGKNYFTHCEIMNMASRNGFLPEGFICVRC